MGVRNLLALMAALALPTAAAAEESECLAPPAFEPEAAAANDHPVRFDFREIGGETVLVASGVIDAGAAERLDAALAEQPRFSHLSLEAHGRDAAAAMAFGLHLRQRGVPVRLRAGTRCEHACAQAFLGAIQREVEPGAWLGFARVPDGPEPTTQDAANWAERLADYYIRTGVSRGLLRLQLSAPEPAICYLSTGALTRYNVTNRVIR